MEKRHKAHHILYCNSVLYYTRIAATCILKFKLTDCCSKIFLWIPSTTAAFNDTTSPSKLPLDYPVILEWLRLEINCGLALCTMSLVNPWLYVVPFLVNSLVIKTCGFLSKLYSLLRHLSQKPGLFQILLQSLFRTLFAGKWIGHSLWFVWSKS